MNQRKNLFIFHLESVSWQTVHAFQDSFPHLHALMATSRLYPAYFASATSTQMVLAACLHGNDFEMDAAPRLAAPAGNNPSLFKVLADAGYGTHFLCASQYPRLQMLGMFGRSIPEVWTTNDFGELLGRFESAVRETPFFTYVWCQLPHTDANLALAPHARQIDELVAGGCAVADNLLGAMLEILRREARLDDTTIVVYGDHGDDYWTHGFKNGLLHGVEPFTPLVHAPLAIRDTALAPGRDNRLASTIDLMPTCLDLLGLRWVPSFPPSGRSMLNDDRRDMAFAQNRTANQVIRLRHAPRKYFSASTHAFNLMVSSRGLELYNFRIDPGNHFNMLHFFNMKGDDDLELAAPPFGTRSHFRAFYHLCRGGGVRDTFRLLHRGLKGHVAAKNRYAEERAKEGLDLIDLAAFGRINREGWCAFFRAPRWAGPGWSGRVNLRRMHKENIVERFGPMAERLYRRIAGFRSGRGR